MSKLIIMLVSGGTLAGLVNYFVIIKDLKFIAFDSQSTSQLESLEVAGNRSFISKFWQFLRDHSVFFGYLIVGIAGALLTPLMHALFGLKGLTGLENALAAGGEQAVIPPFTSLVILGYGLVFGVFAVKVLSSVVAPFVSKLSQVVAGQQREIQSLTARSAIPSFQESTAAPSAPTRQRMPANDFSEVTHLPPEGLEGFVKGVDVSHHNGDINWDSLQRAGIAFVYIKISEGYQTTDPKAIANATAAKSKGFRIGYCHFGRPDTKIGGSAENDAQAEARYVNDLVVSLPLADLPIVLDLANVGGKNPWDSPLVASDYHQWVTIFMGALAGSPARMPIIHSRKNYLDNKLPPVHSLGIYPLWLARYHPDYTRAISAKGWSDWKIWQFSKSGDVELAKFDFNLWKKDHFDAVVNGTV